MTIDWNHFTPVSSLIGGGLIGLAVLVLMLSLGRIAGISGIMNGLLYRKAKDVSWRAAFVVGMLAAPVIVRFTFGLPAIEIAAGWPVLIVAGVLVGFGTRMGSGCTSGHGVCGLSRLSLRSMLATGSFMFLGFVTVYLARHVL